MKAKGQLLHGAAASQSRLCHFHHPPTSVPTGCRRRWTSTGRACQAEWPSALLPGDHGRGCGRVSGRGRESEPQPGRGGAGESGGRGAGEETRSPSFPPPEARV